MATGIHIGGYRLKSTELLLPPRPSLPTATQTLRACPVSDSGITQIMRLNYNERLLIKDKRSCLRGSDINQIPWWCTCYSMYLRLDSALNEGELVIGASHDMAPSLAKSSLLSLHVPHCCLLGLSSCNNGIAAHPRSVLVMLKSLQLQAPDLVQTLSLPGLTQAVRCWALKMCLKHCRKNTSFE